MSSSNPPPDCALQLPSWDDEFDQTEELDYSESELEPDEQQQQQQHQQQQTTRRSSSSSSSTVVATTTTTTTTLMTTTSNNIGPSLPPGFDGGTSSSSSSSSSRLRDTDERCSVPPPDVRHSNNHNHNHHNSSSGMSNYSSFCDLLPNSLPQHFDGDDDGDGEDEDDNDNEDDDDDDDDEQPCSSSSSRPLGPTLPPGFVLNNNNNNCNGDDDEDDPEDPGDPEDPDENDSRSKVPNLCGTETRTNELTGRLSSNTTLISSSGRIGPIGPAIPPGFADCSPSLPDDEIRPRLRARGSSSTLPPPEPEETRVVSQGGWSSKSHMNGAKCSSSSTSMIGPSVPDLLPTVSHHQQNNDDDDDEESDRERDEEEDHDEEEEDDDDDEEGAYGPTVPPDLLSTSVTHQKPSTSTNHSRDRDHDLEMPIEEDEHSGRDDDEPDDDNDVVGPMPPCENAEAIQKEYRQRLYVFEAKKAHNDSTKKREEWMVKLPKKLNSFGLGARVFSKSSGPVNEQEEACGSREWTETPQQRNERIAAAASNPGPSAINRTHNVTNDRREAIQEQRATQLNKDRNVSLLEMHRRKRKLQDSDDASGGESSNSRQPFDRDRDMHVQGLGGAVGVNEIKERCGQLSSRFGNSSSKKFL